MKPTVLRIDDAGRRAAERDTRNGKAEQRIDPIDWNRPFCSLPWLSRAGAQPIDRESLTPPRRPHAGP
jgi:hypothetical protein